MMRITDRASVVERGLGWLALFLLGLTGWAAERLQGKTLIVEVAARLVLGCVTVVGYLLSIVLDHHEVGPGTHGPAVEDGLAIRRNREAHR